MRTLTLTIGTYPVVIGISLLYVAVASFLHNPLKRKPVRICQYKSAVLVRMRGFLYDLVIISRVSALR